MDTPTTTMSTTNISTSSPPYEGHTLSSDDIINITMYVVIGIFGLVGNSLVMIVFGLLTQKKTQVNMFIFDQALIDACTSVLLILFGVINAFRPHIMAFEEVPSNGDNALSYDANLNQSVIVSSESPPVAAPGHFIYVSSSTAEFLCRFWWSRFFLFSCFAISTWNLTVMSIERYFAVLHPMTYSRNFNRRRALAMLVLVWLIAPVMQYFPAIFMYTCVPGECAIQESWTFAASATLGLFLFIWEFVLPVCIMAFAYWQIFRKMQEKKHALRPKKPMEVDPQSAPGTPTKMPNRGASKVVHPSRNITVTLSILFAVYVICWTPNQITFLQFNFGGPLSFASAWYHITVTMAFINCCVNPFIYALRLQKFKKGMQMLMVCQWHRRRHETRTKTNESTSFNVLDNAIV